MSLELVDGIALSQIGHLVSLSLPLGAVLEPGITVAAGCMPHILNLKNPLFTED